MKNKAADREGHGWVFLDTPVGVFDIFVDQFLVVKDGGFHFSHLFALAAIKNVCFCDICIPCLNENGFDGVLDVLNINETVFYFRFKIRRYTECEQVYYTLIVFFFLRIECLFYGIADFRYIEIDGFAVAFYNSEHEILLKYTDIETRMPEQCGTRIPWDNDTTRNRVCQ